MVDLASLDDVLGFLVNLIADGLCIVAGRGDEEIQRLHTGIAGAFRHDIKEFAIWLGMQLIEHHAVGIETVLVAYVVLLHPVVKNLAVYLDAAFLPHNRVPPFVLL